MNRPRVILADDYRPAQETARKLLETLAEVVAMVSDGTAAIEAAEIHRPDVVILDVSMPLMNGFAAAKQLKQRLPDVKVLFLTMHAQPAYLEEAMRIGAEGYVLKRNALTELPEAIQRILQGGKHYPPPASGA